VHRILVIRAGALGDTLMATPCVPALAQRYPSADIDVLVSAPAAALLHGAPGIAQLIPLRQRNIPYWLSLEKMRLVRRIRRRAYDLAIVLEHAPRYYELVERAGVPRIIGFRTTAFDPALHSIANNLRAAGFDDFDRRSWRMLIGPGDEGDADARRLIADRTSPLVGIHAGYGPARRKKNQEQRLRGWAVENFAAVASRLLDEGARIVLTGSAPRGIAEPKRRRCRRPADASSNGVADSPPRCVRLGRLGPRAHRGSSGNAARRAVGSRHPRADAADR
jgi:ADP-heptose:LPS heptosyltransferase